MVIARPLGLGLGLVDFIVVDDFLQLHVPVQVGFCRLSLRHKNVTHPVFLALNFCTGAASLAGVQFLSGNHVWAEWITSFRIPR